MLLRKKYLNILLWNWLYYFGDKEISSDDSDREHSDEQSSNEEN